MVQQRAIRIIFPSRSYKEALDEASLISLSDQRQLFTDKLFNKVTTDRKKEQHHLLPAANSSHHNLRRQRRFETAFKASRFKNSFLNNNYLKFFWDTNFNVLSTLSC